MREITADCGSVQVIGIRHENGRTVARIPLGAVADIVAEYPGGSYTLGYRRRLDNQYWVCSDFVVEGDELIWTVGSHALGVAGDVIAQVSYSDGTVIAQTPRFRFSVGKSLFDGEEGQGENLSDLVEQAITAVGQVDGKIAEAEEELDAAVAEKIDGALGGLEEKFQERIDAAIEEIGEHIDLSGKADKADTVLDTTLSRGRREETEVGPGSFAFGDNATASGDYSHAEGSSTVIGDYSHAEGNGYAEGSYGHAEGNGAALGDYSHAEGSSTAEGEYGHAEGYGGGAVGRASHSEGTSCRANGESSHAEGNATQANFRDCHAEGYGSVANNYTAHAEGESTKAAGKHSHSEGYRSEAAGENSHAEGQSSKTGSTAQAGHAEGYNTLADAKYAHSEGANTVASGEASHAEGQGTVAYGKAQHAMGRYNLDGDPLARSYFPNWQAGTQYQVGDVVCRGSWVWSCIEPNADTIFTTSKWADFGNSVVAFVIGKGASETTRRNAFAVLWDGSLVIGDTLLTEAKLKALLALLN